MKLLSILVRVSFVWLIFHVRTVSFAQSNVQCASPAYLIPANAVCMVSIQGSNCTGILVNNENNDRKPYVLTARHCITDKNFDIDLSQSDIDRVNNATFTFKFRRRQCTSLDNEVTEVYSGAIFRAAHFYTDLALLEIHPNNLPLDPDLVYAGWSRENPSGSFFHIAHPNSDEQKISFGHKAAIQSYDPWKTTVSWDQGGVAGGASGGPLFNTSHQVVGGLSYNSDFGRIDKMWDANSASNRQLKAWLSPYSNHSSMGGLKPFSFNGMAPSIVCNGVNRTINMPYILPGENITWSTSSNIQIINSGYNFVNISANGPSATGFGTVTATWEGQNINYYLDTGKPDLNSLKYDFANYSVNSLNVVSPNTDHYITLYPLTYTSVNWNQSWSAGIPSGSPGTGRFDFQLQSGQSLFFNPLSVTNECGTSTKNIEFWADFSSLQAYPNPATDQMTIDFGRSDKAEVLPDEIALYKDNSTNPVYKLDVKAEWAKNSIVNNKLSIDVSRLNRGTYFMHIKKGTRVDKRKIVLNSAK